MIEVAQIRAEDGTFQTCIINKQMSLQKLKHIYEILKEELWRDTEAQTCKETIGHGANLWAKSK